MTIVANVPLDLERAERWRPPEGWERITTVESHAAGEPLRVVTGGLAPIPGRSMSSGCSRTTSRCRRRCRGSSRRPTGASPAWGAWTGGGSDRAGHA